MESAVDQALETNSHTTVSFVEVANHHYGGYFKIQSLIKSPLALLYLLETYCNIKIELCNIKDSPLNRVAWRTEYYSHALFFVTDVPNLFLQPEEEQVIARLDGSYTYFMKAGNRVKIGKAVQPDVRLRELQTGCPDELVILHLIPGGENERILHRKFERLRIRGEWFHLQDEILEFIASQKGQL